VTEALDRAGTAYRDGGWPTPCRAAWAAAKPQAELSRTFAVQPSQPAPPDRDPAREHGAL